MTQQKQKVLQLNKKQLAPLAKSLQKLSLFFEKCSDDFAIEDCTIEDHQRVGTLFRLTAGDADGNEVELQIWNLSPNSIKYGVGKASKHTDDWVDFGIRGDQNIIYPIYMEVVKQMIALPFAINSLSWDVLASYRGGINDIAISKAKGKKDEYDVKFFVKTLEEE